MKKLLDSVRVQPAHIQRAHMDAFVSIQKTKLWVLAGLVVLNILVRLS